MREAADRLYSLFINVESVGSTQLEKHMKRVEELKTSDEAITLTEDHFVKEYQPILNHLDPGASFDWGEGHGTLFETYGDELSFVRSQAPETIWTLLSVDGCDTIVSGYHFVNRLGYFICRVPVERGITIEVPLDFIE